MSEDATPEAQVRESNAAMDRLIRAAAGRAPQPAREETGATLPGDELRRARLELAAQRCSVLPDALDDVEKLLDWGAIGRDRDEANAIEKAVRSLVARKPYLVGVESADGGAGIGSFRGFDNRTMDQRIRDARDGLVLRRGEAGAAS